MCAGGQTGTTAFLGVERSAGGRLWLGPDAATDRAGLALAQQTGLPEAVARILARRGVTSTEAERYLAPTLRDLLPDPACLMDMEFAAERLVRAARSRERIAVFADYDVDGAASAALLIRWLRSLAHDATLYIPDRIAEGYGPNVPAMRSLAGENSLIICVDCGTAAPEPVEAARQAGADVVVLDHHLAPETLPPATAIVNPNRREEDGALGHLCAAGVVFLLLVAANRRLRADNLTGPDLMGLLDLVALATVADVAPLRGVNRALVRQGLSVMRERGNPGLAALMDVAGLRQAPGAYHLGYALGPRINAGGRIGASDLGARLLLTDHPGEAQALAQRLDKLNRERQAIEGNVLEAAREQATARGVDAPLVWAAGQGWHPGVVGIVAARLSEAFDRPAVVIGLDGGEGKGSGRSRPGIDLGRAVVQLAADGMLTRGGGHAMAAGLTVEPARLEAAMEALGNRLADQGASERPVRTMRIDGLISPAGVTIELLKQIAAAGPFGAEAPAPRFALRGMRIVHRRAVGTAHLQLRLKDADGASLDAIAFGAQTGPLSGALDPSSPLPLHVAGRLEIDEWQGRRRPKLHLEDAAPAG